MCPKKLSPERRNKKGIRNYESGIGSCIHPNSCFLIHDSHIMNSELFKRLKKLAEQEGRVVIVENDEAMVLMSLDEYEHCSGECECGYREDEENKTEEAAVTNEMEEAETLDDDKELLRKVNEDIAKWRAEQEQSQEHKNIKTQEQEENILSAASAPSDMASKIDGVLEDEERYYLEPLE